MFLGAKIAATTISVPLVPTDSLVAALNAATIMDGTVLVQRPPLAVVREFLSLRCTYSFLHSFLVSFALISCYLDAYPYQYRIAICSLGCVNGVCANPDQCVCNGGTATYLSISIIFFCTLYIYLSNLIYLIYLFAYSRMVWG